MGEYLMDLKERPMIENFIVEFTRDIPKSNALFGNMMAVSYKLNW